MQSFQNIRIIDVENNIPDPKNLSKTVRFILSEVPSDEWKKCFNIIEFGDCAKPKIDGGMLIVKDTYEDILLCMDFYKRAVKKANDTHRMELEHQQKQLEEEAEKFRAFKAKLFFED